MEGHTYQSNIAYVSHTYFFPICMSYLFQQVQRACDDASKDIFGDNARELLEKRDLYVDDDAVLEGAVLQLS